MADERAGAADSLRVWVPVAAAALGIVARLGRAAWALVRRIDRLEASTVTDEALAPHLASLRAELRTLSADRAALEVRVAALELRAAQPPALPPPHPGKKGGRR